MVQNERKGNVFLGLIGALLGMIVGLIPNILLRMYANYMIAILFAVVPICIAFGYHLLGKTGGVFAIIITIVLSIAAAVIFLVVVNRHAINKGEYFIRDITHYETYQILMELIKEGETEVIKEVGQTFLFMIIGIAVSWRFVGGLLFSKKYETTTQPAPQNGEYVPYDYNYQNGQNNDGNSIPQNNSYDPNANNNTGSYSYNADSVNSAEGFSNNSVNSEFQPTENHNLGGNDFQQGSEPQQSSDVDNSSNFQN